MGGSYINKIYNMKKKLFEFIFLTRRFIYLSLSFMNRLTIKQNTVFILSYHSINKDKWRFSIDYDEFVRQVDYLLKYFEPVNLDDIYLFIRGKKSIEKSSFAITFDDGYEDILKLKNYFRKNGIRPAFFILSDNVNANRKELGTDREFLNKEEVESLVSDGWILGCHSATHCDFSALGREKIYKEVVNSKKQLEKKLRRKVDYFVYPKGKYSKEILDIVKKAGYKLALSMNDGFISKETDLFTIPRIGVDRTHSYNEFKTLFLPSVVIFKNLIKRGMKLI